MENRHSPIAGRLLTSVFLFAAVSAAASPVVEFGFDTLPEKARTEGKVALVNGLSGKAVRVGDDGETLSCLRFPVDGILAPDQEATISFWVSPLDWNGDISDFVFLFSAAYPDNTGLRLYKYQGKGGFLWFLSASHPEGEQKTSMQYVHGRIGAWKAGEWHHVAITYRPAGKTFIGKISRQCIYVDGRLADDKTLAAENCPQRLPAEFTIGPAVRWGKPAVASSAIDEFRIWRRELSPEEVRAEFLRLYRPPERASAEFSAGMLPKGAAFDAAFERCAAGGNVFYDNLGLLQQRIAAPEVKVAATPDELLIRIRENIRGLKLKSEAKGRDGAVFFDDAYEVFVQVEGAPYRQYIVNSKGGWYDGRGSDASWNGGARVSSVVKDGLWEVKLRIPASDLELKAFERGGELRFAVGRDILALGPREFVDNCDLRGFFPNVKRYQHLRLGETGATGTFVRAEFLPPNVVKVSASVPVGWNYSANGAAATRPGEREWTLELPMSEASVRYDGRLDSGDGRFSQALSILRAPSLVIDDELNPDSGETTVNLRIVSDSLKCRVAGAKASFSMKGKTFRECPFAGQIVFPKGTLPAESGIIDVLLEGGGLPKSVSGQWNYYFVDSDRWIDYDGGLDDNDVPTPWIPVAMKNGVISCLDREYRFDGAFLPRSLTEKGQEILDGPVRLRAEVDGREVVLSEVALRPVRTQRGRIDLEGRGTLAGCEVAVKTTFEFDGFFWVRCGIRRHGHIIRRLALELPFNAENSRLKFVPFMNEKPVQRDDIGEVLAEQHWAFGPGIWVGGDERGVTIFTESDEFHRLADPSKCYSLVKKGGIATLSFNLIDTDGDVPEELRYGFGLQVTPVKPFPQPENWMGYGFVRAPNNRIFITGWGNRKGYNYQGMPGTDGCEHGEESLANGYRQAAALADGRCEAGCDYATPLLPIRYLCPNIVANTLPELSVFRRHWEVQPSDIWNTDGPDSVPFVRVSPMAKSWANFYCWRFDRYFAKSRESGVYQDFAHPIRDGNPLHGAGYERDGKRCTTYSVVKHREINKRLYRIAKKYETPGRPIFFIGHSGGTFVLPHGNFWTLTNDGEYLGDVVNPFRHYTKFFSPARIRAEFNGRIFGLLFNFIPIQGKDLEYNEDMFSYLVPACIPWMHHACINAAVQARAWDVFRDFGFDGVKGYHPFWKKDGFCRIEAPDGVLVSVLEKPEFLLAACGNPTEAEAEVAIAPSTGVTEYRFDGEPGWRKLPTDGTVRFPIKARNFRYVLLRRR